MQGRVESEDFCLMRPGSERTLRQLLLSHTFHTACKQQRLAIVYRPSLLQLCYMGRSGRTMPLA